MFLRRISLDLTGRLPTADEVRAFLEDQDSAKRDKLIDRLLESNEYADFFANKWSTILRNRRANQNYTRGTYAFYQWIRDSIRSARQTVENDQRSSAIGSRIKIRNGRRC